MNARMVGRRCHGKKYNKQISSHYPARYESVAFALFLTWMTYYSVVNHTNQWTKITPVRCTLWDSVPSLEGIYECKMPCCSTICLILFHRRKLCSPPVVIFIGSAVLPGISPMFYCRFTTRFSQIICKNRQLRQLFPYKLY